MSWAVQGLVRGVLNQLTVQIIFHENNLEIRQDWYIHYVHIPHRFKNTQNWS